MNTAFIFERRHLVLYDSRRRPILPEDVSFDRRQWNVEAFLGTLTTSSGQVARQNVSVTASQPITHWKWWVRFVVVMLIGFGSVILIARLADNHAKQWPDGTDKAVYSWKGFYRVMPIHHMAPSVVVFS